MDETASSPDTPTASFLLDPEVEDLLSQSDGFHILRTHLAETYDYDLCEDHGPHARDFSRWLIVRDVLHALLVPVVELFDKAVTLAIATTGALNPEELEYAFTTSGRSAFLWLQCFLSSERERDWCYTKGCPVCVVERTLDSEFSVRLLYAACLLSDVRYPFTLEGPQLPSFRFFLDCLRRALASDPLYGEEFFERMQGKAETTRNGIEELIHQCVELELDFSNPSSAAGAGSECSSTASSRQSSPLLAPMGTSSGSERGGMKVKRGLVARRQMSLQIEEAQWLEEMLKRCFDHLQPGGDFDPTVPRLEDLGGIADVPKKSETVVRIAEVESIG